MNDKINEIYGLMPEGYFESAEQFASYVEENGLASTYDFMPEGYFGSKDEYVSYVGEEVKKKEDTTDLSTIPGSTASTTMEQPTSTDTGAGESQSTESNIPDYPRTGNLGIDIVSKNIIPIANSLARAFKGLQQSEKLDEAMSGTDYYFTPSGRAVRMPELSQAAKLSALEAAAKLQKDIDSIPTDESQEDLAASLSAIGAREDLSGPQKFAASAAAIIKNPKASALNTLESLASQAPYLPIAFASAGFGSLAGTPLIANAFGFGLSAMSSETQLAITEGIQRQGVDLSDPEQLEEFMNNDEKKKAAQEYAVTRGVTIGAAEGLFSILGAKIPGSILKNAAPTKQVLARTPVEFAIEVLGEGAGEGMAQYAATGELSEADIASEMFTGIGRSIYSTATNTATQLNQTGFLGEPVTRDKARKMIQGAKTEQELSWINVDESDRTLTEEYKQKKTELENAGENQDTTGDNGATASEEVGGMDGGQPESTIEGTSDQVEAGTTEDNVQPADTELANLESEYDALLEEGKDYEAEIDRRVEKQAKDAGIFDMPDDEVIDTEDWVISDLDVSFPKKKVASVYDRQKDLLGMAQLDEGKASVQAYLEDLAYRIAKSRKTYPGENDVSSSTLAARDENGYNTISVDLADESTVRITSKFENGKPVGVPKVSIQEWKEVKRTVAEEKQSMREYEEFSMAQKDGKFRGYRDKKIELAEKINLARSLKEENNTQETNGIRTDIQRSEELGGLDGNPGEQDQGAGTQDQQPDLQTQPNSVETPGNTPETNNTDTSDEKSIIEERASKMKIPTQKFVTVKKATKTKPSVMAIRTVKGDQVAFVSRDTETNQWVEVDKDGNAIGDPLGETQEAAKVEINKRYSEGEAKFNADDVFNPTPDQEQSMERARQYIDEKKTDKADPVKEVEKTFGFKMPSFVSEVIGRYVIDTKNVAREFIRQARKAGLTISDSADFYMRSQLFSSRLVHKIEALTDRIYNLKNPDSFASRMFADGITTDELGKYSVAMQTKAGNAVIREELSNEFTDIEAQIDSVEKELASIKPKSAEDVVKGVTKQQKQRIATLSAKLKNLEKEKLKAANDLLKKNIGLTNEEAQAHLESLSDKKKALLEKYDKELREDIIKPILNKKLEAGLITQEEYDNQLRFEYYMATKMKDTPDMLTIPPKSRVPRKGIFKRRGSEKTLDERANPVNQVIADYVSTITNIEKNELNKSILKLAEESNSDELQIWYPKYKAGGVEETSDAYKTRRKESIEVLVDGKKVYIHVPNDKLRKSFSENNSIGKWIYQNKILSGYARYKRQVSTTWNPAFIPVNFLRDVPTALANLNSEIKDAGTIWTKSDKRKILADTFIAVRDIFLTERNPKYQSKMAADFREMRELGGVSTWGGIDTMKNHAEKLNKVFAEGMKDEGKVEKAWGAIKSFVKDANDAVELGVRLAVYRYAKGRGLSKERSAYIAKNITVNFEKKGELGPLLNTLYLFANAGIQSNVRMYHTLRENPRHFAHVGMMYFGAGFAFAALRDLTTDDFEPEPEKYEEETNLLMSIGGYFVKIPMAYGFNVFAYAGNEAYKLMRLGYDTLNGKDNPNPTTVLEATSNIADAFLTSTSPVASATIPQMLAPTILDPLVQVSQNTNFASNEIASRGQYKDPVKSNNGRQGTLEVWKWIAENMNKAGGGSKAIPSNIGMADIDMDMEPEMWRHLILEYAGGGAIKSGEKAASYGYRLATNLFFNPEAPEDINPAKLPVADRFVREKNPSRYYLNEVYDFMDDSRTAIFNDAEITRFNHHLTEAYKSGSIDKKQYKSMAKKFLDDQEVIREAQEKGVSQAEIREERKKKNKKTWD